MISLSNRLDILDKCFAAIATVMLHNIPQSIALFDYNLMRGSLFLRGCRFSRSSS